MTRSGVQQHLDGAHATELTGSRVFKKLNFIKNVLKVKLFTLHTLKRKTGEREKRRKKTLDFLNVTQASIENNIYQCTLVVLLQPHILKHIFDIKHNFQQSKKCKLFLIIFYLRSGRHLMYNNPYVILAFLCQLKSVSRE